MKRLTFIVLVLLAASCVNKKAEIVELIKKTKNEWYEAEMNRGNYNSVATKLLVYNNILSDIKKNGQSQQMKEMVKIYKDAYETAASHLKGVSPEILKSQKKLDSIALIYEMKTWDLKHRLDSLELELKKY
jgi:hypothetical protein